MKARHYLVIFIYGSALSVQAAEIDWNGWYGGANVAYGSGKNQADDGYPSDSGDNTSNGFAYGGQAGYNWQVNKWVWGAEVRADRSNLKGESPYLAANNPTSPQENISNSTSWIATLAARAGYAFRPDTLVYAKAGAAWAKYHYLDQDPLNPYYDRADVVRHGYLIGAGIEYLLKAQISVFADFTYMDFNSRSTNVNDYVNLDFYNYKFENDIKALTFGLNYHF